MSLEEMRMILERIEALEDPQRGPFIAWLIVTLLARMTFYIVLGLVVWSLGRRMIQACMVVWKEARRERA